MIRNPLLTLLAREGSYGSGPVFQVTLQDSNQVIIGSGQTAYYPKVVMPWCLEVGSVPQFCIVEGSLLDRKRCIAGLIAQADYDSLLQIRILSPERETVELIKKAAPGRIKVGSGRLAGHARQNGLDPFKIIAEEAAAGTDIVVFYAYEHDAQEIEELIACGCRHKIEIGFNVRDEKKLNEDLVELALLTIALGATVFCNKPLELESLIRTPGAGE